MDFMEIANDFVDHWFGSFDNTDLKPVLASLYRPESMLVWEGAQKLGSDDIMATLTKPEMSVVKTVVTTRDATPATAGGILITAIGSLAIDNAFDTPISFTSTFLLQPND
ncbi:Nuclear transport factor 2 Eukaryote [Penicillium odoratum]|uniref:Nuclear transport factor 2 Eukaryote n=1 Tax=Penicillium odoratum TaxID=1167516 RepID=UPI002547A91B|nr:Nuclear transport factor 2 Eukaryote [Penicillium odoratum]KAJ5746074.1 Nuclear transport factor 2 Eukaryote [Penicillium odoratum]